MPILDPKTHKVTFFKMPVRDPNMPESLGPGHAAAVKPLQPSPYWGDEKLWDTTRQQSQLDVRQAGPGLARGERARHGQSGLLQEGLASIRRRRCSRSSASSRQVAMLDPKTMKYTFVDTCFGTHHPQFGYDADDTLWLSGTGPVAGWVNTKMFDETGDAAKAQGWSPFVLDTNGNGKRDDYVEPNQPADPAKDKRIVPGSGPYAVMPHPTDGSVWYTVGVFGGTPGFLRFDPKTGLSEVYNVPMPAFGIRGGDIDKNGVALGLGVERPSRQLRPPQVQGAAQRPERDRRSLPRGLGVLSVSRARASRASARTAPRRATTPGSTSTTRSGSARTSRCRPPT